MSTKTKIGLVTGGSRGIGRNMAINLAKNGIDIVLTYHSNEAAAYEVVNEIKSLGQKAIAINLDTSKIISFDKFVSNLSEKLKLEFGQTHLDFLINNAGTGIYKPFAQTTEEEFDAMLNIHFKGVYFLTQKLLSVLNDGGRIINISSGLTRVTFPGVSAYGCMKAAVETFTKFLAKELGPRKITANVIAPGAIATDFGGGANKNDENKKQNIADITALGRIGEPEDIGGVVAFLCTPEAGWMNGQRIELSGGMML